MSDYITLKKYTKNYEVVEGSVPSNNYQTINLKKKNIIEVFEEGLCPSSEIATIRIVMRKRGVISYKSRKEDWTIYTAYYFIVNRLYVTKFLEKFR